MLLGPQEPRLALWPDAQTLAVADELADFAKVIGQPQDPWQVVVLKIGSGTQFDGLWAALEVAVFVQRQNGKGGVFETRGLGGLFVLGERLLIYTAHNMDTVQMAFGRCEDLVDGNDDLRRRVKRVNRKDGEEGIELIGGAELQFRTRGRGGGKGRGLSCDVLFLDEALYLQQFTVDALMPTMLARPNPQIWYLSTPPIDAAAKIMQIRADAEAGVPKLACAAWFNDAGVDLTDQAVLASVNPAYGIRLNASVLEVLRRRLGPEGFARECGGIWPEPIADRWQLIPESMWAALTDSRASMADPVALGVWVTPDRDHAAIAAAGRRDDAADWLVELTGNEAAGVDARSGVDWLAPRLSEMARHRPLVVVTNDRVLADQGGLPVHLATGTDQAAASGLLLDSVRAGDMHHLGQRELTVSAAGATKRVVGQSWVWDAPAGVNVCPVGAASLALWGLLTPRVHSKRGNRVPAVAAVAIGTGRQRRQRDETEEVDVTVVRLLEQAGER